MDFPIFHLDFLGNRMLIAIIAIIHVVINHALAVGFIPLVTLMEYRGFIAKLYRKPEWIKWDHLSQRIMGFGFVITTSVGALTGVGIWFASSLTNPASIGTLVRVFYMAWFIEWIVFCLEVIFIMIYYLSWRKSQQSLKAKKRHVQMGLALSIISWITMAIITAILGFMMDPGKWIEMTSFWKGFFNPIYLPQLFFRTSLAMIMGGCTILVLALYFLRKQSPIRSQAIRLISFWILFWTPYLLIASYLYYHNIPSLMIGNLPVAIGTQAFEQWYQSLFTIILAGVLLSILIGVIGVVRPKQVKSAYVALPLVVSILFLGSFERVREFIRKPYVIGDYMYANGILEKDYPFYQRHGILSSCEYFRTYYQPASSLSRGEEVFKVCCTRCHTAKGVNAITKNFERMYGEGNWNSESMENYIKNMHNVRVYMPPFPGSEEELKDIVEYIKTLRTALYRIRGVQIEGVTTYRMDDRITHIQPK